MIDQNFRLGILGGGQLGKMLALAAGNWELPVAALDRDPSFPAGAHVTYFTEGSFNNFHDVVAFGRTVDVLTIEIEHVNTDALRQLRDEGVIVHPDPDALDIIKDKGKQKQFYHDHNLPTSSTHFFENDRELREAIREGVVELPFVQKARSGGYDGRGVQVVQRVEDLQQLFPTPSIVEPLVDIEKELAVVVARNPSGEVSVFPPVEMVFHPTANLVELLVCPADIDPMIAEEAEALAQRTIETYGICGLLAVELFLTKSGDLLINEVAPRPHNSGHHTIESCETSQFEQHLRAVLDLPLGRTTLRRPAAVVNLLGADGHTGATRYEGLAEALSVPGAHLHLYGKTETRPFRKMGHATVLADDTAEAGRLARRVQDALRIVT